MESAKWEEEEKQGVLWQLPLALALLDSLIPLCIAGRRMVENQLGTLLKIRVNLMKIKRSLATSKDLFPPLKRPSRGLVCRSFIAPYTDGGQPGGEFISNFSLLSAFTSTS